MRSVSDPELKRSQSTPITGAKPMTDADAGQSINPYGVRTADPHDAHVLAKVERKAFPNLEHPTRFRRELQRDNATYFVAERAWTSEERRNTRWGKHPSGNKAYSSGPFSWVREFVFWLTTQRPSVLGGQRNSKYVGGFAGMWFVLDEAHVVIIASRPDERRRGVGELLLIACLDRALRRNSRIVSLEVRASNDAAISLYRKYGFQDIGVKRRYYSGTEDAIIMNTLPIQTENYRRQFQTLVEKYTIRWGESARVIT